MQEQTAGAPPRGLVTVPPSPARGSPAWPRRRGRATPKMAARESGSGAARAGHAGKVLWARGGGTGTGTGIAIVTVSALGGTRGRDGNSGRSEGVAGLSWGGGGGHRPVPPVRPAHPPCFPQACAGTASRSRAHPPPPWARRANWARAGGTSSTTSPRRRVRGCGTGGLRLRTAVTLSPGDRYPVLSLPQDSAPAPPSSSCSSTASSSSCRRPGRCWTCAQPPVGGECWGGPGARPVSPGVTSGPVQGWGSADFLPEL